MAEGLPAGLNGDAWSGRTGFLPEPPARATCEGLL